MKLGTQTASMTNHLHSRAVIGQPEPTVGMGATVLLWTDRHAATITEVFKVGKFTYVCAQQDKAIRNDGNGMSESQGYDYTPNPNGSCEYFRREESGMWQAVTKNTVSGRWNKGEGHGLRIGERDEYYDFSF
jgi:hypothetical protein